MKILKVLGLNDFSGIITKNKEYTLIPRKEKQHEFNMDGGDTAYINSDLIWSYFKKEKCKINSNVKVV